MMLRVFSRFLLVILVRNCLMLVLLLVLLGSLLLPLAVVSVLFQGRTGPPQNRLYSVAALSEKNIWAVGGSTGSTGEGPLIEQWNGTRWHILPPAHPLISSSSVLSSAKLYATAALAANNIWTVGSTGTLDEKEALIEHWNGKEWRIISNGPPLSHIFGNVYGIAVISVESIWAVGDTRRNTGAVLSEHWNGTKWSLISVPDPDTSSPYDPPGSYELRGIAALADDNIWAVGSSDSIGKYSDARTYGMTSKTLIEHWDGRNWRIISSPNPGAPPSIPSFQLY